MTSSPVEGSLRVEGVVTRPLTAMALHSSHMVKTHEPGRPVSTLHVQKFYVTRVSIMVWATEARSYENDRDASPAWEREFVAAVIVYALAINAKLTGTAPHMGLWWETQLQTEACNICALPSGKMEGESL